MKKQIFYLAGALLLTSALSACNNDDAPEDSGLDPEMTSTSGFFVLNQGNFYSHVEGGLTYADYATGKATQNVFKTANNRTLGDTPQCAVLYGSKMYIGVYESNTIEIIDRTTLKSVKQIVPSAAQGAKPRSMVATGGYVYVAMEDGFLSRIDTTALAIDKTVETGCKLPDAMALAKGALYVPNSDGMNPNGADSTVVKVLVPDMTVDHKFTVGLNPTVVVSNGDELGVLCMGNYYDIPSKAYRINADESVTEICGASLLAMNGTKFYTANAIFGKPDSIVYKVHDIATGAVTDMLKDRTSVSWPSAITVDPVTKHIIIASQTLDYGYPSYTMPGYVNEYDADGKFLKKYDAGVCPSAVIFNGR